MKGTISNPKNKVLTSKGKIIILIVTILFTLPLCAAQSSCEQPVTNNYYTNSTTTTTNYYYGNSPVTGAPSISPDFINNMLCKYGNPQTCGTGQALYQDGQTYNIDPTFAPAFFWHESNFGTKGEAQYSKSLRECLVMVTMRFFSKKGITMGHS